MEPEFIDLIRNARKKKVVKFRHQFYVFLICFGISVFLWILVHLSRQYLYTAQYKLNYTQVPWNMKLVESSDSLIVLTIRLQGYEYFSEQFFRHRARQFDVSLHGLKVKFTHDQARGYLLTRTISRTIAEQTSYPMEIISTSPDTIFFTFERRRFKRAVSEISGKPPYSGAGTDSLHGDTLDRKREHTDAVLKMPNPLKRR